MANFFPRWTNWVPIKLVVCGIVLVCGLPGATYYYVTPKYTKVRYQPIQPVPFPHDIHVTQLGMDCRYCHSFVEVAAHSNVPNTQVCMNCHAQVQKDNPKLAALRTSWESGNLPVEWVQIHKTPDYVYFNHSVHVNRGVSCVECHGQINKMEEVYHAQPLSMTFCLDCHRNPAARVRPPHKITDLNWKWNDDPKIAASMQKQNGEKFVQDWKVQSLQSCSACHR